MPHTKYLVAENKVPGSNVYNVSSTFGRLFALQTTKSFMQNMLFESRSNLPSILGFITCILRAKKLFLLSQPMYQDQPLPVYSTGRHIHTRASSLSLDQAMLAAFWGYMIRLPMQLDAIKKNTNTVSLVISSLSFG